MTIEGAWNSAINGMNAFSYQVDNISENLANSATVGYKGINSYFRSLMQGSMVSDPNPATVYETPLYQVNMAGSIAASDNPNSFAISGSGFAPVSNMTSQNGVEAVGTQSNFTRACDFSVDGQGFMVNSGGQVLMAVPESGQFTNSFPAQPSGLVPVLVNPPGYNVLPGAASSTISLNANFPGSSSVVPVPDPASGGPPAGKGANDQTVTLQMFDSNGTSHNMQVIFRKTATNTWSAIGGTVEGTPPVPVVPPGGPFQTFSFDSKGQLTGAANLTFKIPSLGTGANPQTLTLDLGTPSMNSTQYAGNTIDIRGITDATGHSSGTFTGASIDSQGYVDYKYSNGMTMTPYRIALANFTNPDQLNRVTGATFGANPSQAGTATYSWTGDSSPSGTIIPSAVEESNVDITTQLTTMIQAQQSYSSNAKVITASDQMTQTALGILV